MINLNNTTYCFRFADQVSVGDEVAAQKNDELLPEKVVNVSSFTMSGTSHLKYTFISCKFAISTQYNIFNNNKNFTYFINNSDSTNYIGHVILVLNDVNIYKKKVSICLYVPFLI